MGDLSRYDGIKSTTREMTGIEVTGCPWRSFAHPIVHEVMKALPFFESGNLAVALPSPSHRLMEGISRWHQAHSRMMSKQMEIEREEWKKKPTGGGHG